MQYPENHIPDENSGNASPDLEKNTKVGFRRRVLSFKALPWVGLVISLVALFGLQLSTFISLGLSRIGSQHRYYEGHKIIDPIEEAVSIFVIMPAFYLGPILLSLGCAVLIIRAIFRRPQANPNAGNSMRVIGAVAVCLFFVAFTCVLIVFIGVCLFSFGFEYGAWKDTLPFPEVNRYK